MTVAPLRHAFGIRCRETSSSIRRTISTLFCIAALVLCVGSAAGESTFIRGDGNGDGIVDVADPIQGLAYLFSSGSALCLDALDANDDGLNDLADAIYLLAYLFQAGPRPPAPGCDCGGDLTQDGLDCAGPLEACGPWNQSLTGPLFPGQLLRGGGAIASASVAVECADFDNDGTVDVVVAQSSGVVDVFRGLGDGTFESPLQSIAGGTTSRMALGDINDDGELDLVSSGGSAAHLWIAEGNGDATFAAPSALPVGATPWLVRLGFLNRDNQVDIVTANSPASISIVLGLGGGSFTLPQVYPLAGYISDIDLGDMNGDGSLDVVVSGPQEDTITIFLGSGTGTFSGPLTAVVGGTIQAIALGDLDQDGDTDLLTMDVVSQQVSSLLNNGSGFLVPMSAVQYSSAPITIALADLDHDSHLDLITSLYRAGGTLSVHGGLPDGSFASGTTYPSSDYGLDLRVADLNGDCHPDVVRLILEGSIILFGRGDGTLQTRHRWTAGHPPSRVVAADADGDGDIDVVTANEDLPGTVSVLTGAGDGSMQSSLSYSAGPGPLDVAIMDWNYDGVLDLVTADSLGSTVSLLPGLIGGGYGSPIPIPVPPEPAQLAMGDFDENGLQDLLIGHMGVPTFSLLLATGSSTFLPGATVTHGPLQQTVCIGDLNGDGHLDVVTSGGTVGIHFGTGTGGFQPVMEVGVGLVGSTAHLVDINGDSHLDIVGCGAALLGDVGGTYSASISYPCIDSSSLIVDLDGDGELDIARFPSVSSVEVLLGVGGGAFESARSFCRGDYVLSCAAADFDGDGDLELFTSDIIGNDGAVSVLENLTVD